MKLLLICLFAVLFLSGIAFGIKPYSNRRPRGCPPGSVNRHKKCTVGQGYNDCVPYGQDNPMECYSGKGQFVWEPMNGICCEFNENANFDQIIDSKRGVWKV